MVLSVTVQEAGTVYAAGTLPTQVVNCENSSFNGLLTLGFGDNTAATNYVKAINKATVNDTEFTKGTFSYWGNTGTIWNTESATGAYGSYQALKICNEKITFPAKIVISADGYDDMTVSVKYEKYEYSAEIVSNDNKPSTGSDYKVVLKASANGTVNVDKTTAKEGDKVTVTATPADGYVLDSISVKDSQDADITVTDNTFIMPTSDVTVSAVFKSATPAEDGAVSISSINISTDYFDNDWYVTFPENADYVSKITGVSVNDAAWTASSFDPSDGGVYRADTSNNRLVFSKRSYGSNPVLKSGKDSSDPKDPSKPTFEKPSNGNSGNGNTAGNTSANNQNTKTSNAKKTPRTGDESHMMLWIVLILAAIAMSGIVVYRRKHS